MFPTKEAGNQKCGVFDRCIWASPGRGNQEGTSLGPLTRLIPGGWSNRRLVPGLPLWLGLNPATDASHSVPFHCWLIRPSQSAFWGHRSLFGGYSTKLPWPNGYSRKPSHILRHRRALQPLRRPHLPFRWIRIIFFMTAQFRGIHRAGLGQTITDYVTYIHFQVGIKKKSSFMEKIELCNFLSSFWGPSSFMP